jgi:hypothetical protein
MFGSKAKFASKTERTREYVSILKRILRQLSGIRFIFKVAF